MPLHAQDGFSLLEVLIAVGLVSLLSVGVIGLGKTMNKVQLQSTSVFQIGQVSHGFEVQLKGSAAWMVTLNDPRNSTFACLKNATDCRGAGGSFLALDTAGNPILGYLSTSPTAGFSSSGIPCGTFSGAAGTGSDACPFRLVLTWRPVCAGTGPCLNPTVQINGTWIYNPHSVQRTIAFNNANYNFQIFRTQTGTPWVNVGCQGIFSFITGTPNGPNDGQTTCRSPANQSPSDLCRAAGFTAATGMCKGVSVDPSFPGPVNFEGSLIANDAGGGVGTPLGNGYYFACIWGGLGIGKFRFSAPAQILCQ